MVKGPAPVLYQTPLEWFDMFIDQDTADPELATLVTADVEIGAAEIALKLFGVQLFPTPLESYPRAASVLESAKSR